MADAKLNPCNQRSDKLHQVMTKKLRLQTNIIQLLTNDITFRKRCARIIAPGKILNLYTSFGKVKDIAELVQT